MKKTLLYYFTYCMILSNILIAGDHSFLFKIELNETAINRALQKQYNEPNFPSTVTGIIPVLNVPYTIHLKEDFEIFFDMNLLKIIMPIEITSSAGNYDLIISPTLKIPVTNISTDKVKAFLENLPAAVNSLSIPNWAKNIIIDTYNTYEPWIYPSKLINNINNSSEWMKQRGLNITNLTLDSELTNGKLILGIKTDITANKPNFPIKLSNNSIIFSSPWIKVRIDELYIYTTNMHLEYHAMPKIYCEKLSQKTISFGTSIGSGQYFVIVLFTIDNDDGDPETYQTFYSRKYKVWTNVSSWSNANESIN